MKPTKNRVYCRDGGRQKMLFDTEKKADTFIRFNREEIETETGYHPVRSYYCIACNGWHVTSRKVAFKTKSKTEIVLEQYRNNKEKRAIERAKISELKKAQAEPMNRHFENIDKYIKLIEANKESGAIGTCLEILNNAFKELENAKNLLGSKKRIGNAEAALTFLKEDIEKLIARNWGRIT